MKLETFLQSQESSNFSHRLPKSVLLSLAHIWKAQKLSANISLKNTSVS